MEKFWALLGLLLMIGSLLFLVLGLIQFETFFIGIGVLTLVASYLTYSAFIKNL